MISLHGSILAYPAKSPNRMPLVVANAVAREIARQERLVTVLGLMCILGAPAWIHGLLFPFPWNFPLIIENDLSGLAPILISVFALQITLIVWLSAGNRFTAKVMIVGCLLKLAAVSAYIFTAVHVYGSVGDVFYYFTSGMQIADKHSLTGEWTLLQPLWSTKFIVMLTGWGVFLFGRSFQGLMIVFAVISYWGQYLFYRSFCIAFPAAPQRGVLLFMFCLPSIVFWTATIGKDAVILFFLGGCCYGFAKLTRTGSAAALVMVLGSLTGVMLVRPHVAGMLAVSLGCAYLLTRNRGHALSMAAKSFGAPLLLLASAYFVTQARTFVDLNDVEQTQAVLERAGNVNLQLQGSTFGNSLSYRLLAAPFLLFRPLPWEVRNPQMAISAVEALALLSFAWRRRGKVCASLRRCRQSPFLVFLFLYVVEFSLLFAGAMTNFGVLARERDMLIPFAVMIFLASPFGEAAAPGSAALRECRRQQALWPQHIAGQTRAAI